MDNPQVLIVGTGPTGLVLALWLTRAGIAVRIIDKTTGPGTTSRALVMHARNLEFYRQLGIDREATEGGVRFKAANLWLRGKKVARVPFGNMGETISPYPYALIYPQDTHEEMLVGQLTALGIEVERETELVSCHFSGNVVEVEIRKKAGVSETSRFTYLAGCDGAHSTVREKLGISFSGGTYADMFYVADIAGHGPVFNGEMNGVFDESDFMIVFPMKGAGRARLVGTVSPELRERKDLCWDDVSHDILRQLKMTVDEVRWFSTYRVHHRVASRFQERNIFLLGDAAHVHSPVGGQGMNTGIGDAVNLGWKLAAVLKGESPERLLDTYEPERIAFARRLVATTDRAFSLVTSRSPLALQMRLRIVPRLLPFLFRFVSLRRAMFRVISQVEIQYPQSALSHGPAGTRPGGKRLPWVRLEKGAATGLDNFCGLVTREWQIHCYGEATASLKAMCDRRGVALHVFPWNSAARKAGLRKNGAYVVRPDGHIGIMDPDGDGERIAGYLEQWCPGANRS